MGGASEWQGGQLPLVLYVLLPAAPSRRERKKYMFPLEPFDPLSQRKVLCKTPRNVSKHCTVNVEFLFIFGR